MLIFEFKKLREQKDNFRAYEGKDGMRRRLCAGPS